MIKGRNKKYYYLGEKFPNVYLTYRQVQCVECFIKGFTNRETGIFLGISTRTVEDYLTRIKQKVACKKKSELIEKVLENDFLSDIKF